MHQVPSLLKQYGSKGNSLIVKTQLPSGRSAIGSRLSIQTGDKIQIDEVRSGGYHISQSDFRVHFGLGPESKVDITVQWPDGSTESHTAISSNQWITIRQGKGIVSQVKFQRQVKQ